jgi:hypothetical protein
VKLHLTQSGLCLLLAAFIAITVGVAHREAAYAQGRAAGEPAQRSALFGYLVYHGGNPVGGAEVILVDSVGRRRAATHTDAFGYFEIGAQPATYTIRATQRGAHIAATVAIGPGVRQLDLPGLDWRPAIDDTSKLWGLAEGVLLFFLGYAASASTTWRRRSRVRAFILRPVVESLAQALPAFSDLGGAGKHGSEVLGLLSSAYSASARALPTGAEPLAADDPRLWRAAVDLREHLGELISLVEPQAQPELVWRALKTGLAEGREPSLRAILRAVEASKRRAKRLATGRLVS